LQDAHSLVRVFDTSGKHAGDVPLPGLGSVAGFPGRRSDRETYFSFSSFTSPSTIFRYDLESGETKEAWRPAIGFDPEKFETRQVFYASKDGTRVPMFVTAKKETKLDGNNPTLLYGYGGFDNAITPAFSVSMMVWLEMGGVYAVANLRGGGEYGKEWHEAGMKDRKQNVFDDFLAAAEWLIDNRYTSRERLAITGRSNGGLLVGACMTQRPGLFAAAIPEVGVMDMLRYHKFTIGWAWVSEYGSSDDPEEFKTLLGYSPLHNIKPGTKYPATLVTTADHDDRVVPAHSFKFAATLQAAHAGDAPCLIRIETSAGHGAGTPTAKAIALAADRLAFLAHVLKVPAPDRGR
jgi:prolyl oligopeptidase